MGATSSRVLLGSVESTRPLMSNKMLRERSFRFIEPCLLVQRVAVKCREGSGLEAWCQVFGCDLSQMLRKNFLVTDRPSDRQGDRL